MNLSDVAEIEKFRCELDEIKVKEQMWVEKLLLFPAPLQIV